MSGTSNEVIRDNFRAIAAAATMRKSLLALAAAVAGPADFGDEVARHRRHAGLEPGRVPSPAHRQSTMLRSLPYPPARTCREQDCVSRVPLFAQVLNTFTVEPA